VIAESARRDEYIPHSQTRGRQECLPHQIQNVCPTKERNVCLTKDKNKNICSTK